jgi:hypothetical protein
MYRVGMHLKGDVQLLVVVDEAVKLEQFPAKLTIKPTTQGMG